MGAALGRLKSIPIDRRLGHKVSWQHINVIFLQCNKIVQLRERGSCDILELLLQWSGVQSATLNITLHQDTCIGCWHHEINS